MQYNLPMRGPGSYTSKDISDFLAEHGYTSDPEGLVEFPRVEYVFTTNDEAYLDINADAVRKGDIVPDRPIRLTFRRILDGLSFRWACISVEELTAGGESKALNRQQGMPRVSPW